MINRSEFQFHVDQLQDLHFEDATSQLVGFIEWLEEDAQAKEVLEVLRDTEVEGMMGTEEVPRPKCKSPTEVASVGLCLIDSAKKHDKHVFQIGDHIGVQITSSRVQDHHDEVARRYLNPLFNYLESKLFTKAESMRDGEFIPASITFHEEVNPDDVFIVHGRDEETKLAVARFLEGIELKPIILHEQSNRGRTIIEKFEDHAAVRFAVIILTPDDIGRLATEDRRKEEFRARQNVLFEMGYFIGKLGRDRVFPLRKGNVAIPSDYKGVVYEEFDEKGAWKIALIKELKGAGYSVDANAAFE